MGLNCGRINFAMSNHTPHLPKHIYLATLYKHGQGGEADRGILATPQREPGTLRRDPTLQVAWMAWCVEAVQDWNVLRYRAAGLQAGVPDDSAKVAFSLQPS